MTTSVDNEAKATSREASQIVARLQKIDYATIPLDALRRMQETLDRQIASVVEALNQLEVQTEDDIQAGNPDAITELKEQLARRRGHLEDLNSRRLRIYDTIQRRILRDRLAEQLGSYRMVVAMEIGIFALIILVLGLLFYEFSVGEESLPTWLSSDRLFLIDSICCAFFMAEFFLRLKCADSRRWFWKHHWIDFVTSIPIPGQAQMLRFGRIARVARIGRVLRLVRLLRLLRVVLLLWRGMDKLGDAINVKLMKRTLFWGIGVMIVGGFLVFTLERSHIEPEGDMSTWTGAMWWSFTTVVTGGFGDIHNPTTTWGRILTVILIIMGMILVGVFTATLTSLYVGEESEEMQEYQEAMNERLAALEARIEELVEQLKSKGSGAG